MRLRKEIKIYLENGKKNIVQILDHLNKKFRMGSTMQQLGNVLSKDRDIIKVGKVPRANVLSGSYLVTEWALKEDVVTT
jgi:hypothetical protein